MKIFYVDLEHPWRAIFEHDVEIIQCKKRVWAIMPNGKRRLLGASVFFTIESAKRCQKALLEKQMHGKSGQYIKFQYPKAYLAMEERMKDYLH